MRWGVVTFPGSNDDRDMPSRRPSTTVSSSVKCSWSMIACSRVKAPGSAVMVLPAEELGKYKMIFQMFALEGLLIHYVWPVPGTGLSVDFQAAGMRFLWIAMILAVWSGIDYAVRVLRRLDLD